MNKGRGGLGFKDMYGFNIALLGKHVLRCISKPHMLVSRILKAKYFPDCDILRAKKGQEGSCIWSSIWQAKEVLKEGFRWVVGDGVDIRATKDPWLRLKRGHCVEDDHTYVAREERVADLFIPNTKIWDVNKIRDLFSVIDSDAILATIVPQHQVCDQIAWTKSSDGIYNVKTGYQYWVDRYSDNLSSVQQSIGWRRIWNMLVPHKMKVFVWRLCRNNIPVRNRLRSKGVLVTIVCPFCNIDVEHLLHVFFDCQFAASCWRYKGVQMDMSEVESAPNRLLQKLETGSNDEVVNICTIMSGIWYWRNKKVWESKEVIAEIAMTCSFNKLQKWKQAQGTKHVTGSMTRGSKCGCFLFSGYNVVHSGDGS